MPTIKFSNRFKKDYKREKSGKYSKNIDSILKDTIDIMESGNPFPQRYFDHSLYGNWMITVTAI